LPHHNPFLIAAEKDMPPPESARLRKTKLPQKVRTAMNTATTQEGFLDRDGCRIHYRVDGSADAPALVFSNSLGSNLAMWDPQMPEFTRRFRVVRYDSRGHGNSSVGAGGYTIEKLGNDVVALLDLLGITKTSFCGLSMGGMVGMWLGLHAPTRIERLVLCDTAARIGTADSWAARIESVRKDGMAALAAAVILRWFTAQFVERDPQAVERIRQMLLATPSKGYVATCAAIAAFDAREEISRIRAQTLVISGRHDEATTPADGRFLAERIPGARYIELAAAHLSNIEAAPEFTREVSRFLPS
jgi:3-oxoadipate enol-lactonase